MKVKCSLNYTYSILEHLNIVSRESKRNNLRAWDVKTSWVVHAKLRVLIHISIKKIIFTNLNNMEESNLGCNQAFS